MSLLHRGILFSRSLKSKTHTEALRGLRFGWNAQPPFDSNLRTSSRSEYDSGSMAEVTAKRRISCSSSLADSTSAGDGKAPLKRVSIEGNIGENVYQSQTGAQTPAFTDLLHTSMSAQLLAVGKSTFAKLLSTASPDWEVIAEPVSKWQTIESRTSKVCTRPHPNNSSQEWKHSHMNDPCCLPGARHVLPDHREQPAPDDVPGPPALVLHIPDLLLHEPLQNTAAASSCTSAELTGIPCPGV